MKRKVSQRAKAGQKIPGGMWLTALFAAPFAVAGLAILMLMVAPAVYDWARMRSWQPVPAKVELALVQNHPASRGRVDHTVSVRYRYQFDGGRYKGTRASISERPDNIGDFQQRLGGWLRDAMNTESPVQIWVNPRNPAESTVDRSLRLRLLVNTLVWALACCGIGLLMPAMVVRRVRHGAAGGGS